MNIKKIELALYAADSGESDKSTLPELDKEYEIVITEKFGKKYSGFINGFRIVIDGDDYSIGEKLKIKVYDFTKSGKSAKAEVLTKLSGENSSEDLEYGKEYEINIVGFNKRGEYYGVISQQKVIVIGAKQQIGIKYKIKLIDSDATYFYAQILLN